MSASVATTPADEQRRANLRGIVAMCAAVGLLSLMDACLKLIAPHYPPLQVAALRGIASWPLVLGWVLLSGGLSTLRTARWPLHLMRGALAIFMLSAFAYALRHLPLADAYAIFFVAPLLITALSVPFLGERVEARRWIAIAVGLAGVAIVLRPSGSSVLTLGGIATLAAAAAYALSAITVRVLGRSDSTQSMVFWLTSLLALGAGALAAPAWVTVRPQDYPVIAGVAVTGALGQYAITEAFKRAQASVIAPFEYTALAWGLGLDWLLWQTSPSLRMLAGAAVIIASGVYLIHRERAAPLEPGHP